MSTWSFNFAVTRLFELIQLAPEHRTTEVTKIAKDETVAQESTSPVPFLVLIEYEMASSIFATDSFSRNYCGRSVSIRTHDNNCQKYPMMLQQLRLLLIFFGVSGRIFSAFHIHFSLIISLIYTQTKIKISIALHYVERCSPKWSRNIQNLFK